MHVFRVEPKYCYENLAQFHVKTLNSSAHLTIIPYFAEREFGTPLVWLLSIPLRCPGLSAPLRVHGRAVCHAYFMRPNSHITADVMNVIIGLS